MGILGQNVLSHLNFLLDYGRQTIRFEESDEIRSIVNGEAVPLDNAPHRMIVTAEAGNPGGTKLHLLLDSGANVLVLSHTAAGPAHVILDENKVETTLNAKLVLAAGRILQLTVASRELRNIPVTVSSAEQMEKISAMASCPWRSSRFCMSTIGRGLLSFSIWAVNRSRNREPGTRPP